MAQQMASRPQRISLNYMGVGQMPSVLIRRFDRIREIDSDRICRAELRCEKKMLPFATAAVQDYAVIEKRRIDGLDPVQEFFRGPIFAGCENVSIRSRTPLRSPVSRRTNPAVKSGECHGSQGNSRRTAGTVAFPQNLPLVFAIRAEIELRSASRTRQVGKQTLFHWEEIENKEIVCSASSLANNK